MKQNVQKHFSTLFVWNTVVITLMKLLFIGAHTIVPRFQFVLSIFQGCFCWRVSEAGDPDSKRPCYFMLDACNL